MSDKGLDNENFIFFGLILTSCYSSATLVVVEPDDFAGGADLSEVSPYVTLSTVSGEPVFSSTIHQYGRLAADGNDTSILGDNVFSRYGDRNSEWYYWPERHNGPSGVEDALMLSFSHPVDYFSLVFAELFPDAGCCIDDPILVDMFDREGALIESVYANHNPGIYLGELGELGVRGEISDAWPVYEFTNFSTGISKVIVGGESEPTTIDRLTFKVAQQVPEPSSFALMFSGLVLLLLRRRLI